MKNFRKGPSTSPPKPPKGAEADQEGQIAKVNLMKNFLVLESVHECSSLPIVAIGITGNHCASLGSKKRGGTR